MPLVSLGKPRLFGSKFGFYQLLGLGILAGATYLFLAPKLSKTVAPVAPTNGAVPAATMEPTSPAQMASYDDFDSDIDFSGSSMIYEDAPIPDLYPEGFPLILA